MILLCGIPTESPLAAVIDRCAEIGARTIVFNQRDFDHCHLRWTIRGGRIEGHLTIAGVCYDLEAFCGVYARLMDDRLLPELDGEPPDSLRRRQCRRFHDGLASWIDLAPGRMVNRFRAMGSNGSKPYQAQLIRRYGFLAPETLVTNDPALVRAFHERHGRVIYKSISGLRSIVTELGAADLERLDALRACPVQFQAYVPGFDVRVHTVGDEVIATRIDSPGTDYRYADHGDSGTTLEPFNLSDELADRCRALAHGVGLALTGIDLRITPDNEVYCFEVNPSPAYTYYEAHTGQPISLALARYLQGSGTHSA
jgi:RimK-like ATP-grasp domain